MAYRVVWSPTARLALENALPAKVGAAVWQFARGALADNPRRVGKPLRFDLEGLWSARRGDYRMVYQIDDDHQTVMIVAVDHRSSVYRR
jgi:mRNA-degrading endonuclease RelE of RelBE toxin-antitoxin system